MIDGNVINEIVYAVSPYVKTEDVSDVRMRITMALSKYDITKAVMDVVPYQGDVNERILKQFLIAKTAAGRSKKTIAYYQDTISRTLAMIGKPYTQVTANDVRIYLAVRVNRDGVSKTCANNERRNLSAFYTWLQKEEILLKNPMNKVEAIKEQKKKKKAFSNMELEKIRYACVDAFETALVEMLISTWCRVSEVCEIKISDINEDKILVHGKGDKYREVYLTAKAQLAVKKYLEQRSDDSPYLFPKGMPLMDMKRKGVSQKDYHSWWQHPEFIDQGQRDASGIGATIRKIGKRAGVENCHPHRFRRTGATMALRTGMPIIEVSKLLGHESIDTTQIYLDIEDKQLQATHEKYVI